MNRRKFVISLGLSVLTASLVAEAQQQGKIYRIGMLFGGTIYPPKSFPALREFELELGKHGYIVGRNVVIVIRSAEGKLERLPDLAAELVALKVDVIVSTNPAATVAAKEAAPVTPIVFANVTDPVGTRLVASLARPGGT